MLILSLLNMFIKRSSKFCFNILATAFSFEVHRKCYTIFSLTTCGWQSAFSES